MTTPKPSLLPCPFCGGAVSYNDRGKVGCDRACIGIDAEGYEWEWNTRPIEAALLARAEAAEEKLEKVRAVLDEARRLCPDRNCLLCADRIMLVHALDAILAPGGGENPPEM